MAYFVTVRASKNNRVVTLHFSNIDAAFDVKRDLQREGFEVEVDTTPFSLFNGRTHTDAIETARLACGDVTGAIPTTLKNPASFKSENVISYVRVTAKL